MKICPKCSHTTKESERIEKDKKTKVNWLIKYCAKCGFNYDLEKYDGEIKTPQEEMDQYTWPPPPNNYTSKPWYGY